MTKHNSNWKTNYNIFKTAVSVLDDRSLTYWQPALSIFFIYFLFSFIFVHTPYEERDIEGKTSGGCKVVEKKMVLAVTLFMHLSPLDPNSFSKEKKEKLFSSILYNLEFIGLESKKVEYFVT